MHFVAHSNACLGVYTPKSSTPSDAFTAIMTLDAVAYRGLGRSLPVAPRQ